MCGVGLGHELGPGRAGLRATDAVNTGITPVAGNRLLAVLPTEELEALAAQLEWVSLPARAVLHHQDADMSHVYFPTSGLASLVILTRDGATVEMATIGREGVVGVPLPPGRPVARNQALQQVAGEAARIGVAPFRRALDSLPALNWRVREFGEVLFALVSQNAACNRLHTTDQRLSRWLLMCRDRLEGNVLLLTQELLGQMLGVRQASVSEAAAGLQQAGLIRYHRGSITIVDPAGLEATSCECYERIRSLTDGPYAPAGPPGELRRAASMPRRR
jgi:CRP-like cAMP-binding protein